MNLPSERPERPERYDRAARVPPADAPCHLAIVGAGLVGMACALGAAQAGLRVALIGKPHGLHEPLDGPWDQRVYAISAASRRFLQALRVWDRLDPARVAPVLDMHVYARADAARGLHFSAYEVAAEGLAWIVEHRELARVLHLALDFQQGITRYACEADEIRLDADAAAVSAGPDRMVQAQLLVGADGAHSLVRQAAGLDAERRAYGQHGVVANFRGERPHGGAAWQWFTEQGIVALLPLPGLDRSLVWSAADDDAAQLVALDPAELARRVGAIAGQETGTLVPLGGARSFPLGVMRVPRIVAPRLALVGDAAHLVHPLAGQGLNLGFQDVEVLLDCLAARGTWRDCGDLVPLRRYERARAAPVQEMRWVTDGLQRLFGTRQPVLARLREDGMNLLQGLPVLRKALIRHAMLGR